MTTQEKIAVMQAYAEGSDVEAYDGMGVVWKEVIHPVWDWATTTYRVKRTPREFYAIDPHAKLPLGPVGGRLYGSKEVAKQYAPNGLRVIKLVEVIE